MRFASAVDVGFFLKEIIKPVCENVFFASSDEFDNLISESLNADFIAIFPHSASYSDEGEIEIESIRFHIIVSVKNLRRQSAALAGFVSIGAIEKVEKVRQKISSISTQGNMRKITCDGWQVSQSENGISVVILEVETEIVKTKQNYYKEEIYGSSY